MSRSRTSNDPTPTNSGYEIKKNVPFPAIRHGSRTSKYPFATMGIGDSFAAPDVTSSSLSGAARNATKRYGSTFRVRTVDGVATVWRTA